MTVIPQSILTKSHPIHSVAGVALFILSYLSVLNLEIVISCPSLARVIFKILCIPLTDLLKPSPDCTIFTEMDSTHAPPHTHTHMLPILLLGGLAGTQLLMSSFCQFLRSSVWGQRGRIPRTVWRAGLGLSCVPVTLLKSLWKLLWAFSWRLTAHELLQKTGCPNTGTPSKSATRERGREHTDAISPLTLNTKQPFLPRHQGPSLLRSFLLLVLSDLFIRNHTWMFRLRPGTWNQELIHYYSGHVFPSSICPYSLSMSRIGRNGTTFYKLTELLSHRREQWAWDEGLTFVSWPQAIGKGHWVPLFPSTGLLVRPSQPSAHAQNCPVSQRWANSALDNWTVVWSHGGLLDGSDDGRAVAMTATELPQNSQCEKSHPTCSFLWLHLYGSLLIAQWSFTMKLTL